MQEMFTLTIRAFNLAEKYRTPVILLSDEVVAHMREKVVVPPLEGLEIIDRKSLNPEIKPFLVLKRFRPCLLLARVQCGCYGLNPR